MLPTSSWRMAAALMFWTPTVCCVQPTDKRSPWSARDQSSPQRPCHLYKERLWNPTHPLDHLRRVAAEVPLQNLEHAAGVLERQVLRRLGSNAAVLRGRGVVRRLGLVPTREETVQLICVAEPFVHEEGRVGVDTDMVRATERFGRLCDLAQSRGLRVNLEFIPWMAIPDLTTASVLRSVNRPNAGMLVDTLHFDRSDSSIEELKTLPREWFRYAHVETSRQITEGDDNGWNDVHQGHQDNAKHVRPAVGSCEPGASMISSGMLSGL